MKIFVIVLNLLFATAVWAGEGDERGNGGGGLVCGSASPPKVLLLDLWEAETLLKWPLVRSNEPITYQVTRAIMRLQRPELNPSIFREILAHAWLILVRIDDGSAFLDPGISISPPSDANNIFFPTNCPLAGVAVYNDKLDKVFMDKLLYTYMSDTDKAGLIVHEAVYKLMRDWFHTQNSVGARKLVGCLFRQTDCANIDPMWRMENVGTVLKCKAGDSRFSLYAYGANQTRFQYTQFEGIPVIGETIATTTDSIFRYSSIKLHKGIAKITMTADRTELADLISEFGIKKTLLIGGKAGSALTVNNKKVECTY